MQYEACVFDFDFTLADASEGIIECVNYALVQMGLPPAKGEIIKKGIGMTLNESFFALMGRHDEELAARFISQFHVMADKIMTASTRLFDDTEEVLSRLKRNNYKIAIVTNKRRYRVSEVLDKNGLAGLVDYVVGFEDVVEAKPANEGLLKAAVALGVPTSAMLYVGDSLIDAQTAKNAAVGFAAVTTGETTAVDFIGLPHVFIAESLTDLMGFLCL